MFCLFLNLLVFEPTIAALGIAAIITAIAALSINSFGIQLLIWSILSVALAVILRGMVPRESHDLDPPTKAEVSVSIPRGGMGEVAYEGTLWSARCQVSDVAIAAGQTVYVVGRQDNTLLVMPTPYAGSNAVNRTA
jgi:membrane protein implicated in regulation of membrane protease activity